jgi:hypothetical protein
VGTFLSNLRQITHTKRFEGRKVRVVSINTKAEIHAPHPARLLLDLGDEYLVIDGYFSGDEFIEEGRQRRSKE